jgi:Acyl-coenzyme A:6-aminopenicillanic acid acyl-transferase
MRILEMNNLNRWIGIAAMMLVGVLALKGEIQAQTKAVSALKTDTLIAGGKNDFLEARHIVLEGSNEAIGKALAEIARDRHGARLLVSSDRLLARTQRRYFEKNAPLLLDRMRGVAAAYGKSIDDDGWNFSWLDYGHFTGGCSVIHFPPNVTADGRGLVSRDYDFTTGRFGGERLRSGEQASTTRPYVVEMYPERGYASLAVYSYDLLNGVIDGVNSEGLTVALLADDELEKKFRMEPAGFDAVGLGVVQVLRLLLDTCASVEEAKEALLMNKQYYEVGPVHYLVADRHGKAFVWEYSHAHNREYIVENPGKPLVTTNFSLHSYLEDGKPPSSKGAEKVCPRYCTLAEELGGRQDKLTVDQIKETHKLVDMTQTPPKGSPWAPTRTLWHVLYSPEGRSMQISFYLRDEPDTGKPNAIRIVRSPYRQFKLDGVSAAR